MKTETTYSFEITVAGQLVVAGVATWQVITALQDAFRCGSIARLEC